MTGTNREDVLNQRAKDLESATDQLRSEFDRHDTWQESKDDVQKCLDIAADLNGNIRNHRYGGSTENNWRNVVRELNALAQVYNLPQIGSGAYK